MRRADGSHRVVVTGMGWATPLGSGLDAVWARLLKGDSAVSGIKRFDASTFATNFAAETPEPDLSRWFADPAPFREASIHTKFALAACADAWRQAGFGDVRTTPAAQARNGVRRERIGLYFGMGEGLPDFPGMRAANTGAWISAGRSLDDATWARIAQKSMSATRELEQEPNVALGRLAHAFDAGGPAFNCMTACAASTQSIGEAYELLRAGAADVMLAGGSHTMIHPLGMTGFIRLTAMSKRCDDPRRAARPFDQTRDGFVMGEGAGVVVIETLEHATMRGATPIAEISGYGSSADAFRITDIQPEGVGAQAAMRGALDEAGIDPLANDDEDRPLVHYISAHGTGTKENDSIETKAIKAVFGANAPRVPVSSIKSMMGHLIQAAGAVEFITCALAIQTGWLPPTINLNQPDPACDLDYVPITARDMRARGGVRTALSNSFGFGGQNNTLLITRFGP